MSSYETQYNCETSSQGYPLDQYEASNDSSSSSPRTHYSTSSLPTRDNFPTPSTDSSNEPDEPSSINYHFNGLSSYDPSKIMRLGEGGLNNFLYNGHQLEHYYNSAEGRLNFNGDNILQSYSVANFDPNFVPNRLPLNNQKTESENKPIRLSTSPKLQNTEVVSQQYLMQPPDSDSIEAATANAKRKRPQRRSRTKFEKEQLDILESTFQKTHYPDVNMIDRISRICNLTTERISVWFQNRRARFKRTKKGQKEEAIIPNHNPILEELGLYNSTEMEKNNFNKFEEQKSESVPSPLNENQCESDVHQSEETTSHSGKPLFSPMTLPTTKNSQNASQNYYMPLNKTEPFYYQENSNQLDKSELNEPADEQNNISSSPSRNSSPKPESNTSTPSPNPEQTPQNIYAQFPSAIGQYGSLPSVMNYQSGFGNFYMPPIQNYAQNIPNIFQPYIDYNKPDIPNFGYFHGLNAQTLPSYYGSA